MSRRAVWVGIVVAAAAAVGAWQVLGRGGGSAPGIDASTEGEGAGEDPAAGPAGLRAHAIPPTQRTAPAFHVRGTVVDAAGAPVVGVRVTATRTGPVWDPSDSKSWGQQTPQERAAALMKGIDEPQVGEKKADAEAESGEGGAFDLSVAEPGNYDVEPRPDAPRYGTRVSAPVTAARPETTVRLRVLAGSRLRGRVVDPADRGVAAVVRGQWEVQGTRQAFAADAAATDPGTGDFALEAVPEGRGSLTVVLPGRISLSGVEVTTPYEGVLVIRVGSGGVLKGTVTNREGLAVAGADVAAWTSAAAGPATASGNASPTMAQGRAKSGPDGAWRMEGVPPGKVGSVTVAATGYSVLMQAPPRAPWTGAEIRAGQETVIDLVVVKGGAIFGRATQTSGGAAVPIADVQVQLARCDTSGGWYGPAPSVTTDADGRFRFDDVALGKYVLIPTAASHFSPAVEAAVSGKTAVVYDPNAVRISPASLTVVLTTEGEEAERNLEMRRGLPVRGRVVGPDGAPVEGAKVRSNATGVGNLAWQWGLPWGGNDGGPLAVSGPDGRFEIPGLAPRDGWVLSAAKDDFVGVPSEPFAVAPEAPVPEVTLRMEVGGSLSGRVIDGDGKPLVGWTVWYWPMEAKGGFFGNTQVTTDGDGAFTIRGLPAGKGQLQANGGTGGAAPTILDPPLGEGEKRTGVEIRIEKGVEVSGILVDADGKTLAGQSLSASGVGSRGGSAWAATRSDGTFALAGVPAGLVQISVSESTDEGYGRNVSLGEPVTAPCSGLRLVYTAKKKTTVTGRVTDAEGRPVPLCVVEVGTRSNVNYGAATNPNEVVNGEFARSVEGTPPFSLTVSAPRDAHGQPLNLKSEMTTVADPSKPVVVVLQAGTSLAGRVLGPDAQGVGGVTIRSGTLSALTDDEGRFRLLGLGLDRMELTIQPPPKFEPPGPVSARPGDDEVVVRLTLGASIAGRLEGPDGRAITSAGVNAEWKTPGGRTGISYGNADPQGRFEVQGLPTDAVATLTVSPWSADGTAALRPKRVPGVRAGTDDVVVRLEPGVAIEGRVVHADGTPAPFSWVQSRADPAVEGSPSGGSMNQQADGTFRITGLAPGSYLLTPMGRSGRPLCAPVRVNAPARDVRIVVVPPVRLTGRIEGALAGVDYWAFAWPAAERIDAPGSASGRAAADGTFALEVAADTEYMVGIMYAQDDRYALGGPVRAGGADVVLRLQPGASIEGILEDASGAPKGAAYVMARSDRWRANAKTDAAGAFRLRGLPPGRYMLTVAGETPERAKVGEADAGATGLRLRLPAK